MYENYGVCLFDEHQDDLQLNFTHRTAHGGDADITNRNQHGVLNELANTELARLKQ